MALGVAAVTSTLFRYLRQPSILGYLAAGLLVGPYIPIRLFADAVRVHELADFGVVLVMFAVGLELRIGRLLRVLPIAGATGLVQIGSLTWLGFSLGSAFGWSDVEALFLGCSIAISSTMVVSNVLSGRDVTSEVREFIFGLLILQDMAAVAFIAMATAMVAGDSPSLGVVATALGRLSLMLVLLVSLGVLVVPRAMHILWRLKSPEALTVGSTALCFSLALLAETLGYSIALGAFVAGVLVAESGKGEEVELAIRPLRDVFAAVFFVAIGMTVDPALAFDNLGLAFTVASLVVIVQLVSVSFAGVLSGNGLRRSVGAGLALGQIGEFAFVISAIGVRGGIARPELTPILVTVGVITAFTTPLAIGSTPRLLSLIDHHIPRRLKNVLVLYETWFDQLRTVPVEGRHRLQRIGRALALDTLGLVFVTGAWKLSGEAAAEWLGQHYMLSAGRARLLYGAGLGAIALPLTVGIFRNTDALAHSLSDAVFARGPIEAGTRRAAEALVRVSVQLTVALSIGIPAGALLRPLLGSAYIAAVLLSLLVIAAVSIWRAAARIDQSITAAADGLLEVLASTSVTSSPALLLEPFFPGIDRPHGVRLNEGAPAVNRTLAELDLRAQTGASVLAIRRAHARVVVPTGSERLAVGDELALAGTRKAIERARSMLLSPIGGELEPASPPVGDE